ncbi:MAG: glycosyltransferase family 2 protein [Motiliproteus sp.]
MSAQPQRLLQVKTISAALMVKDEEEMLERCLQALTWADEIVLLDSGSTDRTLEIARQYTDKIFVNDDWQGFGMQRQRLHDLCTGDWILMVDADEVISPELAEKVAELRQDQDCNSVFRLRWQTHVFGKALKFGGWCSYKLCLYPKAKGSWDPAIKVHERLTLAEGVKTQKIEARMHHYSYRDMEDYLVKSARYAAVFAEQREARGKQASLTQAFLHGLGLFIKMYLIRGGFLDGRHGLLMALLSTHSCFVKYADLWSRTKALK